MTNVRVTVLQDRLTGPRDDLVRVRASGVCGSVLHAADGDLTAPQRLVGQATTLEGMNAAPGDLRHAAGLRAVIEYGDGS